jgi:hypothetical protein
MAPQPRQVMQRSNGWRVRPLPDARKARKLDQTGRRQALWEMGQAMVRHLFTAVIASAFVLCVFSSAEARQQPAPPSPFADWAAIVVAADWRAATRNPTEAFDNARRDIAEALLRVGFQGAHMRQFSSRPEKYPSEDLSDANYNTLERELGYLTARARGGCLVYLTSHGYEPRGDRAGIVLGRDMLTPPQLASLLNRQCGNRPAIVVVSACFSGAFIDGPMLAPNRLILTAARADRTSFGCGEGDRYPFFDGCLLENFNAATDWLDLAERAERCVAAREVRGGHTPSEPQRHVGADIQPLIETARFR